MSKADFLKELEKANEREWGELKSILRWHRTLSISERLLRALEKK